jgi:hypothetical protein
MRWDTDEDTQRGATGGPRAVKAYFIAAGVLSGCLGGVVAAGMDVAVDPSWVEWHDRVVWRDRQVVVTAEPRAESLQVYRFAVSAGDGGPDRQRTVAEANGRPRLRTHNPLFDGLFALALEETSEDSVSHIQDGAFNGGNPIACECFETGAKWHYVWTRDLSYAVDLGLAALDPMRAKASLLFKQSGVRPELLREGVRDAHVVAQDTGSGGSWPVSTDRVVWIHAATDTLKSLTRAEAAGFAAQLYRVAVDTMIQDRDYAYDPLVGLYRGETSFLDWREQNYPPWTAHDTRFIAESFALSTNVLHYVALRDTAELARRAGDPHAGEFDHWAVALRMAINDRFWLGDAGLYASYLAPGIHPWPVHSHDLLGLSLAVIHGVAGERRARLILQHYPSTAAGPPVVWPEQPGIAIYHNRALWPFVTAYAVKAAKCARQLGSMSRFADSLMRGAAMSLSNMENFEFLTQATVFEDGERSGPVINSPRQLWSVAGYLSLVLDGLWGLEYDGDGIRFDPVLPGALAARLFAGQREISLRQITHQGMMLDVTLELPSAVPDTGALVTGRVRVNGKALHDGRARLAELRTDRVNDVRIVLRSIAAMPESSRTLTVNDPHALTARERHELFAPPPPPTPGGDRHGSAVHLQLPAADEGAVLQIYRNGVLVAAGVHERVFQDLLADGRATACYALVQRYEDSAVMSLPSAELCLTAARYDATLSAGDGHLISRDGHPIEVAEDGRKDFADWGSPQQELRFKFTPKASGLQRLRVEYANAHGPINTGITAAQKRVAVTCRGDRSVREGSVVMPHLAGRGIWGLSTAFVFRATRGDSCAVRIHDGFNMSYLEHFDLYTGGEGGHSGALNRASIAAVHLDFAGLPPAPTPASTD